MVGTQEFRAEESASPFGTGIQEIDFGAAVQRELQQNPRPFTRSRDLRRKHRHEVTRDAVVSCSDGIPRHCAQVINISVSGIMLRSPLCYPHGASLLVSVPFHGATIALVGKVMWTRCEGGSIYTSGLKFTEIMPSAFGLLTRPFND